MTVEQECEIQVVRWQAAQPADTHPEEAGEMLPASPRHARRATLWERTLTTGQQALATSSESIAQQVDVVAARMIAELDRRETARLRELSDTDPTWRLDDIEVSFAVQLTGETSIAVFSASGESSAEIALRFTRQSPETNNPGT